MTTNAYIGYQFRSALPHGERHGFQGRPIYDRAFRSALPHGERPQASLAKPLTFTFRSALPHGERQIAQMRELRAHAVSIRAPARGATWRRYDYAILIGRFDPRSRTGSDSRISSSDRWLNMFRSALPHGERRRPELWTTHQSIVSIRAPARGATRSRLAPAARRPRFDPRSRTGSDRRSSDGHRRFRGFDPRSRTGSDMAAVRLRNLDRAFRSALPHGERRTARVSR